MRKLALCFLFILVGDSKELAKYMFEKIQKHQYEGKEWPQVSYLHLEYAIIQVAQVTLNTDLPPFLLSGLGKDPKFMSKVKAEVLDQIQESLRLKDKTKTLGQKIFWFYPQEQSIDKLQQKIANLNSKKLIQNL